MKYPVYKPYLTEKVLELVTDCVTSTWISSKGKYIDLFERKFAQTVGQKYAVSCSNGTTALHLALLGADIKRGDEVIVPTLTYIASVNSVAYCNATPVFIDCYQSTWTLNVEDVKKAITKKTKAIIAVNLYGQASVTNDLKALCKKNKITIIEDCAESLGSKSTGQSILNCYSFFGNKTITTGEGGMVTTNNKRLADKIRKLKGQGLAKDREYFHDVVGYNYRMTNIQAAIGFAQLDSLPKIIFKKRQIDEWYIKYLPYHQYQITDNDCTKWLVSMWYFGKDVSLLRKHLLSKGIETRPVFYPAHMMPMYRKCKRIGNLSTSIQLSKNCLSLPSYPDLTESDVRFICKAIKDYDNKSR